MGSPFVFSSRPEIDRKLSTGAGLRGFGTLTLWVVRREPGKEPMVQVHYCEGIANRTDPESCVTNREGRHEAVTGERISQPLSRARGLLPVAGALTLVEGNTTVRANASVQATRRGLRPGHVRTLLVREPGDLQSDRRRSGSVTARIGKVRSRSR